PLRNPWLTSLFRRAQKKAQRQALSQRKGVLSTDDWLDESLGFAGSESFTPSGIPPQYHDSRDPARSPAFRRPSEPSPCVPIISPLRQSCSCFPHSRLPRR